MVGANLTNRSSHGSSTWIFKKRCTNDCTRRRLDMVVLGKSSVLDPCRNPVSDVTRREGGQGFCSALVSRRVPGSIGTR
jgi:hypothetical protein